MPYKVILALSHFQKNISETDEFIEYLKANKLSELNIDVILSEGVITYSTNYAVLMQINEIVEEGFSYTAGKLRTVPVSIGGSNYIPPLPYEIQIKEEINNIAFYHKIV